MSGRYAPAAVLCLLFVHAAAGQESYPVPQGMVAFFAGPLPTDQPPCPFGWKEAQYAAGRLILGTTKGDKIRIARGTALGDREVPMHSHTYSGQAHVGDKGTATVGGKDKGVGRAGTYGTSGTTEASDSGYPFVQYLICEFFAESSGDVLPYATVSFFNLSACPENWASLSTFEGRFILATPAEGGSGTANSKQWSSYEDPGHSHTYSGSVSIPRKRFVSGEGANKDLAAPGAQPISGDTSSNTSPIVPFVTLLVCQKTQPVVGSSGLPKNLTVFLSAASCDDNWGVTPGAPGRLLVGMSGSGTQGATFGGNPMNATESSRAHPHYLDGTVTVPHHDTDLSAGWPHDLDLGRKGQWPYATDTESQAVELPIIILNACTFTG